MGGSLILADIYFNGSGVKRDVPLAIRFACEWEPATAMLALPDIAKLDGSLPARRPFEFCDYAATTFTENFCTGYASEIADNRRTRYYRSLKSSMTPEQQAAFEKLLAAQSAYIEAHAFEVDQGGSIRNIRTAGSEDILNNLFHRELVHFERKEWPALSEDQINTADAWLNREYETKVQQLRSQAEGKSEDEIRLSGAVTADHLSKVQQTWETYRGAWDTFARVRYPAATAAIHAKVALDRYRLLKTIE